MKGFIEIKPNMIEAQPLKTERLPAARGIVTTNPEFTRVLTADRDGEGQTACEVEIARRTRVLSAIIPDFKMLGLRIGIKHLATLSRLDENLENSMNEPWQRITAIGGHCSTSSGY